MNQFDTFRQPKYSTHEIKNKAQSARCDENTLKLIHGKKAKVAQYEKLQKTKSDLYWKLSQKLQQQLKQKKNHNTPQARQKLNLLQKCRNQKHIRTKKRQFINEYKENTNSYSLARPKSCCPVGVRSFSSDRLRKRGLGKGDAKKSEDWRADGKENLGFFGDFNYQFQRIKEDCVRENRVSQEIREGIDTVHFYQKLITKNSSLIFTKIL